MSFRRYLTVVVLGAAASACGDSTGPEDFSPTTTNAKAEAVLAAFDGNTALASLRVLAPYFQLSVSPVALTALSAAPFNPTEPAPATVVSRMRALEAAGPSLGTTASLALFPADLLGKTLVFNPDSGRYVVSPNATGAPAAGIRLTLYAVDPVLNQIVLPLNPVGYLDLIDVSTPSADAVRILAVVNDVTYLDYTASATRSTSSATVSAQGFLSNGTDQVDFDLSLTATLSSLSIDYLLSSGGNSVRLVAAISGQDDSEATLTVKGDGDTIVLAVTITPSTVSGDIKYNGDVAVTISGTPEAPTFTRPDGTPLTEQEIAALKSLGDIIGNLFDAFDNLLAPAFVVFALA